MASIVTRPYITGYCTYGVSLKNYHSDFLSKDEQINRTGATSILCKKEWIDVGHISGFHAKPLYEYIWHYNTVKEGCIATE